MRWPLRNQILWQLLALIVITVIGITIANIRSTTISNRRELSKQVAEISRILSTSRFPLTSNVLEEMKSLSGADFVVTKQDDSVFSKTSAAPGELPEAGLRGDAAGDLIESENQVSIEGQNYFHTELPMSDVRSQLKSVHVFVSQEKYRRSRWHAVRNPLTIAAFVIPIALLFGWLLANSLTKPLSELQQQVGNVALGNWEPIDASGRNDEVRDLKVSVNEMVKQLQKHEEQLKQSEQLKTLVTMGSGIAHNLRNCATGCKMAVELLGQQHEEVKDSANLDVAKRQLDLMNKYIERFLRLAKVNDSASLKTGFQQSTPMNSFAEIIDSVLYLLKPTAEHLGVELIVNDNFKDTEQSLINVAYEDLEQLVMNLVSNAISAASENSIRTGDRERKAYVRIGLSRLDGFPKYELSVCDNGAGPPAEIAGQLFEPFVSGKPEGSGLGLALVEEIVERAGGEVSWSRAEDETRFAVELPISGP